MTIRNFLQAAVLLLTLAVVVCAPAQTASTNGVHMLQYAPGMSMKTLAGHADSEVVAFPNGLHITVKQMRQAQDTARVLMAKRQHQEFPLALRTQPTATGTRITSGADISAALRRNSGSETLQLPSGKTITTGQLQLMQAQIEARTGRKLTEIQPRPTLAQANIILKPNTGKEALHKQLTGLKDSDIVATPSGKVVSVGEVRQYFRTIPGQKDINGRTVPTPIVHMQPMGGAK